MTRVIMRGGAITFGVNTSRGKGDVPGRRISGKGYLAITERLF